jgi:hypothetical protein
VAAAQSFLSPSSAYAAPPPDAVKPFLARLKLTGPEVNPRFPPIVQMYYSSHALNELAEAQLAAQDPPTAAH